MNKTKFNPFDLYYVETFIVPASMEEYTMRPTGTGEGKEYAKMLGFILKNS